MIPYIQQKTTQLRKNLCIVNKSGLQKDTSKTDDIIFRGGAHTQQDFRQKNLNLTGSEPYLYVSAINFTR